jgi:lipopolysaccharide export system permease protein
VLPEGEGLIDSARHLGTTAWLIADLWGPRLLQLFTYLNGIVLIAAMGFTCVQLVRHREFVAMLAGGISLHRAGRPFLIVGVLMIAGQAAVQEFAVPMIAHLLPRDPGDSGKASVEARPVPLSPDADNRLWHAGAFDDATGTLVNLNVWERDASNRLTRLITADRAVWDGRGWVLESGSARQPPATPGSAPPPARRIDRLNTSLDPARLKVRLTQGFAQSLSLRELSSLTNGGGMDDSTRERLERTFWGRIAGWCCTFIALWGALSLFLVRSPRPMFAPALRAAPIALAGFAAGAAASSLAIPGLPVWFGAFVPCAALLSITVALATGVET